MYAWLLDAVGVAPGVHAEPATPEQFTSSFVTVLQRSSPMLTVNVLAPMELQVKTAKGESSTVFLGNAYNEYLSDPAAIDDIIRRYVASFGTVGVEHTLEPANIIPVIKDRGWFEDMRQAIANTDGKPSTQVWETYNDELMIVYAEDTPTNTRYFSDDELSRSGLKRDNLRTLAIANLKRILPEIEMHQGPNIAMLTAGGDYVASLLLFDELWTQGKLKVDGEIVVAVPSRDVLLLTGSKDAQGLENLQAMATEAARSNSYRLTDTLFVYRRGKFETFTP